MSSASTTSKASSSLPALKTWHSKALTPRGRRISSATSGGCSNSVKKPNVSSKGVRKLKRGVEAEDVRFGILRVAVDELLEEDDSKGDLNDVVDDE